MPAKPAQPPHNAPALVRPAGAPDIVSRDLYIAYRVVNALYQRAEFDLFPDDLPPEEVRAHIQRHLDEELAHSQATKAQAEAVNTRNRLEKQARALRTQVADAIDGAFPPGHPFRGAFFPAGAADHAPSQYTIAFGNGMKLHPLKALPPHLTADYVLGVGHGLEAAEKQVEQAKTGKGAASTTRGNLEPRTAVIASRLSAQVRSRHGRTSKDLAFYGLKVQIAPDSRRKRPSRKAVTPEPVDA